MNSKLSVYLESQRRDSSWNAVLNSLIDETFASFGEEQTRHLLLAAGMRAAQAHPLPECDSIPQLEQEVNQYWASFGWGVVTFTEHSDNLEITHEGLPAQTPPLGCFADFLQGMYQQWFRAAGAGEHLHVRQINEEHTGVFSFRLVG